MLSSAILTTGTDQPASQAMQLRAGPLTLLFEPATAWMRTIKLGEVEVLRAIYAAVRDRNWGTVTPQISNLSIQQEPNSFRLSFDADCREGDIHFTWHGVSTGSEQGEISFLFDGIARTSFLRNRIGFCVLHPLKECAGRPCTVEKADGSLEQSIFPRFISPHQPFKNIRAMAHELLPGLKAEVRFEGDVFETEDQRNWTDASYKTYCTPLELPFPVRIATNSRVRQTVTLRLVGRVSNPASGFKPEPSTQRLIPTRLDLDALRPVCPKPPIGLGMASHGQDLSHSQIERLRQLRLNHLRLDLNPTAPDWPNKLTQAAGQAAQLGTNLHLALFLSENAANEAKEVAQAVKTLPVPVSLWLVFHQKTISTPAAVVDSARSILGAVTPGVPVAAGTDANFAELNRGRLSSYAGVLPCFSINPQVHAFDNLSLMENLEAQAQAAESAFEFARSPVVISPVTLRPRFNAVATSETVLAPDTLPPQVDPRQMSLFGAAWSLGSLAALSTLPVVHSLTYYETTGWRGVMETETGSAIPQKFPSLPGSVFPLYFVFRALADCQRLSALPFPPGSRCTGLAGWDDQNQMRLLIANLSAAEQRLELVPGPYSVRPTILGAGTAEAFLLKPEALDLDVGTACTSPTGQRPVELTLPPYGLAQIHC